MLLAIDTGNTNTIFAVHDMDGWIVEWRIATNATRTADEYAVWFHQLLLMQGLKFSDITDCVISTVVPQSLFNMRNLARRHLNVEPVVIGDSGVKTGISVDIDNPREVGADRLVTALGAVEQYEGDLIIIDSGTATTFDVVTKDRVFEGGIICPGINLSMKALHEAAAQLPRIAIQKPNRVIGKNTIEAMQSGVFWGYIGLIDGLVNKIKREDGRDFKVIGTGGVVSLFEGASETIDVFDSTLTINGLFHLWCLNK